MARGRCWKLAVGITAGVFGAVYVKYVKYLIYYMNRFPNGPFSC